MHLEAVSWMMCEWAHNLQHVPNRTKVRLKRGEMMGLEASQQHTQKEPHDIHTLYKQTHTTNNKHTNNKHTNNTHDKQQTTNSKHNKHTNKHVHIPAYWMLNAGSLCERIGCKGAMFEPRTVSIPNSSGSVVQAERSDRERDER